MTDTVVFKFEDICASPIPANKNELMAYTYHLNTVCSDVVLRAGALVNATADARNTAAVKTNYTQAACLVRQCHATRRFLYRFLVNINYTYFEDIEATQNPTYSLASLVHHALALLTKALVTLGCFEDVLSMTAMSFGIGEHRAHTTACLEKCGGCGCDLGCGIGVRAEGRRYKPLAETPLLASSGERFSDYTIEHVRRAWRLLASGWEGVLREDEDAARKYREALLVISELLATSSVDLTEYPAGGPFVGQVGNDQTYETLFDFVRVQTESNSLCAGPRFLAEVCAYAFLDCSPVRRWPRAIKQTLKEFPSGSCVGVAWRQFLVLSGKPPTTRFPGPPPSFLPTAEVATRKARFMDYVMSEWIDEIRTTLHATAGSDESRDYVACLYQARHWTTGAARRFAYCTKNLIMQCQHDAEDTMEPATRLQHQRKYVVTWALNKVASQNQVRNLSPREQTFAYAYLVSRYCASNRAPVDFIARFMTDERFSDEDNPPDISMRSLLPRHNPAAPTVDVHALDEWYGTAGGDEGRGDGGNSSSSNSSNSSSSGSSDDEPSARHSLPANGAASATKAPPWLAPYVLSPTHIRIVPAFCDDVLVRLGTSLFTCPHILYACMLVLTKLWSDGAQLKATREGKGRGPTNDSNRANQKQDQPVVHPLSRDNMFMGLCPTMIEQTFAPVIRRFMPEDGQ